MRFTVVAALSIALSCAACSRRPTIPAAERIAVFEAHDIWDGDNGETMTRLGFPQQGIYRLDSLSRRTELPLPIPCCVSGVRVSPSGDRFAVVFQGADPPVTPEQRAVTGVQVLDLGGRELAWFPRCYAPQWSADGSRLAMIDGQFGDTGWLTPTGIRVVDRSGDTRRFAHRPDALAWGNGDTLFLQYEDRVEGLDIERSTSWRSDHAGCEVSPDGQYSFRLTWPSSIRVRERATGQEIGSCIRSQLIAAPEPYVFAPFWIRSSARGHLLCLTVTPSDRSPIRQEGIRTVVFDPRRMEVVHEIAGKLVRPTHDHHSLVVLRGDTLAMVDLPAWEPEPARTAIGRIRVRTYAWGGPQPKLINDSVATVAAGDWLDSGRDSGIGNCGKFARVVSAPDSSQIELELVASLIPIRGEGVGATPISFDRLAHLPKRLVLDRTALTLRTPSVDGGYDVVLTLVP